MYQVCTCTTEKESIATCPIHGVQPVSITKVGEVFQRDWQTENSLLSAELARVQEECASKEAQFVEILFNKDAKLEGLKRDKAELVKVVGAVEWVEIQNHALTGWYCPWCGRLYNQEVYPNKDELKHAPDCPRQAV